MKLRFCEWLIKHGMRKLAHSLSPSLCCLIDTRKAMNRLAEENLVHLDVSKKDTKDDIHDIYQYFEQTKNIYQFLDKPHSNLIFDAVINQLIYPMHFNPESNKRYLYKAKTREMFTDISVFDECRYIYEWLPALHQIKSAFENTSWQYVFRFSLDGLIKSRICYNNEFFSKGQLFLMKIQCFPKEKYRKE